MDGLGPLVEWDYRVDFVLTPFEADEAREAEAKAFTTVAFPDPITWDSICANNELYRCSAALPTTSDSPPTLLWNPRCTAVQYVRPNGPKITRHLTYTFTEVTRLRNGELREDTITVTRADIQNALRPLIIRDSTHLGRLGCIFYGLSKTSERIRDSDWMDAAETALDLMEVVTVRHIDLGELFPYYF